MSSSRSHLDHRPPGFGVPPSVFETREGLLKKLEMLVFSGSNPFGWIAQVERYFCFGQFHGLERAFCKSVSLAAQKDGGVSRGLFSQGSKGTGFGSQSGYKGAPPVANRQATGTSF
ncbi:unnamed protein product, partial [Brassica oleracea var. botrytis]